MTILITLIQDISLKYISGSIISHNGIHISGYYENGSNVAWSFNTIGLGTSDNTHEDTTVTSIVDRDIHYITIWCNVEAEFDNYTIQLQIEKAILLEDALSLQIYNAFH